MGEDLIDAGLSAIGGDEIGFPENPIFCGLQRVPDQPSHAAQPLSRPGGSGLMVRASVKPSPASLQHGRIELVAETVKEFRVARLCPCPRRYSDGAPAQPYVLPFTCSHHSGGVSAI